MIRAVLDTNTFVSAVINVQLSVSQEIYQNFIDPDDNKILSAGVEGQVNYIVTRDKDLLDLKEYQRIKIITPEDFMGILRTER